jgi:hypothetical protein
MTINLLQQLDLDYYRSVLLHVAHAELERLRQERSAGTDVERWSESAVGTSSGAGARASLEAVYSGAPIPVVRG